MAQSYTSLFIHLVSHTANNIRIPPDVEERLYPYIGGIIKKEIGSPIAINGMDDHIHALFSLKADISVSKASQLIKGNASKWLNETFDWRERFHWQEGYGAFSVGLSSVERAKFYIQRQKEHHRKITAREEWDRFVKEHIKQLQSI